MSRDDYRDHPERGYPRGAYSERRREDRAGDVARTRSVDRPFGVNGGGGYYGGGARPVRRQPPRNPRKALLWIAAFGVMAFAAGFTAMWALGSVIVGGSAFGGSNAGELSASALPVESDSSIQPLVDLLEFRDLAYVPVKAVHVLPTKSVDYFDRVMAAIDATEINSIVITLKDDYGRLAFNTELPLGNKYGTISASAGIGIQDLDTLVAKLSEHHIQPIARIVCFKDNILARKRPEMAVKDGSGEIFVDGEGQAWLNPYNHDAWEYLVQVAEECARRGFREIQFDYVRFPSAGTSGAMYPGQYCAKEDAIAGFLAYARPRLEALGVWMSADVFGWVVGQSDDMGIGQKLEKMCQNVDVLCPMVYPSLYSDWSYSIDKPMERPYDIVHAALTDAATRLVGTGAKGRPYLLSADSRSFLATGASVKAQIQAAEDMGFNEWMLWGGYVVEALRAADGSYNGPPMGDYGPGGTTGTTLVSGSSGPTVTE